MIQSDNPILNIDLKFIYEVIGDKNIKFKESVILVTGCAGFLGYYFLQYFVRYSQVLGIKKIIALDTFILDKPVWLKKLSDENNILSVYECDISAVDLNDFDRAKSVNYVIHAASIASPTFYRKFPLETCDANIWGLKILLDFYSNSLNLKGFIFFSSSEIYGDPHNDFIPTNEEYNGNVSCIGSRACYDESKRFGETLCWIYAKSHNMPITVARPFNNYGPGMRLDDRRLPADFAKAVIQKQPIEIYSNGRPTRTFCYISDAICGYILCLLNTQYDYFNIGADGPEIDVIAMAHIYKNASKELFGFDNEVIHKVSLDSAYLENNPNRRCPDISKAKKTLGYNPKITPKEGVYSYLTFLKNELKI